MTESMPSQLSTKPGVITIARHGRPDANREARMGWRGYEDWWDNTYQPAKLVDGEDAPDALKVIAVEADIVFASTLRRAIETANAAAPGRDLDIQPCLIEAELPPPPMPGVFMAKTWGVFARCSWWLGAARGRESRQEAEARAGMATAMLIQAAQDGPVLACAHGWFNRMMRPHLKQAGWRCTHDGGDGYWAYRQYEYMPS
jgi:broad specificity phosphatase PhoE